MLWISCTMNKQHITRVFEPRGECWITLSLGYMHAKEVLLTNIQFMHVESVFWTKYTFVRMFCVVTKRDRLSPTHVCRDKQHVLFLFAHKVRKGRSDPHEQSICVLSNEWLVLHCYKYWWCSLFHWRFVKTTAKKFLISQRTIFR